MRGTARRVLAALLALIVLMGQLQLNTLAVSDESDSSGEPPATCASEEESARVEEADEDETTPKRGAEASRRERERTAPDEDEAEEDEAEEEPVLPEVEAEDPDGSDARRDDEDTQEQIVTAALEGEAEETCSVTLSGALPEGAQVVAEDAVRQAEKAGLEHILCAYDITIDDGWQPEEAVEVAISHREIDGPVRVYHIADGARPEEVPVQRTVCGEVSFQAEGFSIYVVTEDLIRRTFEFLDYNYGSWVPYQFQMSRPSDPNQGVLIENRQVLRNGDTLVVPSLPNKNGMRFLGWYTSPTEDVNLLTPERGGVKNDILEDTIVTLYARYGRYLTLTFYARPEGTAGNQVFDTQTLLLGESDEEVTTDLSEQLHPEAQTSGLGFVGWKLAGSPDTALVDLEHFTARSDAVLYPVFTRQWKLSFAPAAEDEEYMEPVWVPEDGLAGRLTDHVPTRPGYRFSGWQAGEVLLTDAQGVLRADALSFSGGTLSGGVLRLERDVTLRALWTEEQALYRVVFWQERATDTRLLARDGDGWAVPEAQKEYDYVGSLSLFAPVGTVLPAEHFVEEYGNLGGSASVELNEGTRDFTGMVFHGLRGYDGETLEQLIVTGDGSGTVQVYYDREVVTLRFNYPEDITQTTAVAEPDYTPALTGTGTVTQQAVTGISHADYPEDVVLHGLYGGLINDGRTGEGEAAQWPASYQIQNLSATVTSRSMQYSGGTWVQRSTSSMTLPQSSPILPTHWQDAEGNIVNNLGTFGHSGDLLPTHTAANLREWSASSTVSYYMENEQAAYPASAVYASTPAYTFTALNGETVVVENPFTGFELDYFTYTDASGTPIRRESSATAAQRTLTGGSFSNLKVYCKRSAHHIVFHNGAQILSGSPGVKYGMSLATDYVKQFTEEPELPAELAGQEDQWEFTGWYMDPNKSILLDFAGRKSADRARLMLQYENIHEFASVYDYRSPSGQVLPAMLMGEADVHLYAGWVPRRVLVELEPEGGVLPDSLPTFFWVDTGSTLKLSPIEREYVPWDGEGDAYLYHIHTYEQSQRDNDTSDRGAYYLPADEGAEGRRYAHAPDSYRFLGWFRVETRPNGSEHLSPYDPDEPLTESVKLRAQWSRRGVYQIVYDAGDHGTLSGGVSSSYYRDHAAIALKGDVTAQRGYAFTGWRIRGADGALSDRLYSSGDELVINADWAQTTQDVYAGEPKGVITLVAQYQKVTATSITYYVNGGEYVGPVEGASDTDWQALQEKLEREYGIHAQHHYLYDDQGGVAGYTITGIEQNENLVTEDGTWFQRTGYKLMGWSSTPDGAVELELNKGGFSGICDPEGEGVVLYAVWRAEKKITYELQGGTWNSANSAEYRLENDKWVASAGSGESAPIPAPPAREGYAFAGWSQSSNAKSGMQTMPRVNGNLTLYAIWTTNVVLRFELGGGAWESVPKGLIQLDRSTYGASVNPGSSYTLPTAIPVRSGDYLFHKWEQGSYQYAPGSSFRTSAEQSTQTLTLTARWSEGVPVVEVLVNTDESVTVRETDSVVGSDEDGSLAVSQREMAGYQFLYVVYDEEPESVDDIAERYRVTGIRRVGENTYEVSMANGQRKTYTPGSAEKLQAVYVQDRTVDVRLVRMNVFEDGLDQMNLTLTPLKDEPYTQLNVGTVDIAKALPKPKEYAKVGSTAYRSFTYAIGRADARNMYGIDTMTQKKLWIRQTLRGFAFSVNGEEWKEVDRESGSGKDVAVYIIYDNRVETPTTITHTVYGLKSDKEKLFTYQVYVKGRWGFNIGVGAYFLNKPDDPSEELNSYTVALQDGENVLIPLHIDYISGQNQTFKNGSLFYDMFGNDNPTRSEGRAEKRIWQEVEMRRTNELPFTDGSFETEIQMRNASGSNHNLFNGYDTQNKLWLKQLGISKFNTNTFRHAFIYRRTSLNMKVHVLKRTRDGLTAQDDWLTDGSESLSVTADGLTLDEDAAGGMVNAPEGYTLEGIRYGLTQDELAGTDQSVTLKLAAEQNDATLFHVYDYENAASASRALVPDGSEVYLIYHQASSAEVPVQYVKRLNSGVCIPVDLRGYGLYPPTVTVTNEESVDFRALDSVLEVNEGIAALDALYLTGTMYLADSRGNELAVYPRAADGVWAHGTGVSLINGETGLIYGDNQSAPNVRVWVEVADNLPLRVVGRLQQRGSLRTNTGVFSYLPRDEQNRVTADGTSERVEAQFAAFQRYIPYAKDPEAVYVSASLGGEAEDNLYSVAYRTKSDGFREWVIQETQSGEQIPFDPKETILYATYQAFFSPVNVRYVLPDGAGGFREVEDMDEAVLPALADSIRVDLTPLRVSEALAEPIAEIDGYSALYRTTGSFALGSADLSQVFCVSDGADLVLTDSTTGLNYEYGAVSGSVSGEQYPDLYVILRPIATLTVTCIIDDEGGFANWDEAFPVTVRLSDPSYSARETLELTRDETLEHANEGGSLNLVFQNGTAVFTLRHGQSVAIPELPRGVSVTVTEQVPRRYRLRSQVVEGALVTETDTFPLERHTAVVLTNISRDIAQTGAEISDGVAYALLLTGGGAYALCLLLRRRRS